MAKRLSDFSALTFDCYGTLIDWESGIWDALQPLIQASGRDDITRATALEAFAQIESAQQAATPDMIYPEILARVHAGLAERFGFETDAEMERAFGGSLPHWPAFPDTADALRSLKKRYKLVILSNVNRDGFAASNRKLGVAFDAVYTAEDVRSYKPDPRNFPYMLERLAGEHGLSPGDILHTAQSLFHDHVPAKAAGLARAWIDRQGLSGGGHWGATAQVAERPEVDFLFPTMAAMAEAVIAEG
ncbi:MAG: haloacid dehalogenase type II [Rhodospirillales bacterium]|nr:haloacid dehalogenase type II [Rhodospirillales bacterium]